MPTLKQNLNVLKNGIQRRGTQDEAWDSGQTPATRDHYDRWANYHKRQYPKKKQTPWADVEVLKQAVGAARDTPMGIVDTVTREYITYWMPEIMLFVLAMDNYEGVDDHVHVVAYKRLADRVRREVLDVLGRIDCGGDHGAGALATTLREKVEDRLSKLFVVFEDQLTDEEKHQYNPKQTMSLKTCESSSTATKTVREPLPEARILDSSLAWGLSETRTQPKIPSPRKRRYSQLRSSPGPDPADNGQVWDSPRLDFKRQKFDFKVTNTIKHSLTSEYTILSPHRTGGRSLRDHDTVNLTDDGDDDDDNGLDREMTRAQNDFPDARESLGTRQNGGQCILM